MKFVGIEVAKTSVVCCVLTENSSDPARGATTYKPQRFKVVSDDLKTLIALGDIYTIEPTGVYSRIWIEILQKAGRDVRKVAPARVTHLRRYCGIETKSDRYDAYFLALYGLRNHQNIRAFL